MAQTKLNEGETKETHLPTGHKLIERMTFGRRTIEVEKLGIMVAKVDVGNYGHWESAFEAVMDKAGL